MIEKHLLHTSNCTCAALNKDERGSGMSHSLANTAISSGKRIRILLIKTLEQVLSVCVFMIMNRRKNREANSSSGNVNFYV